MKSQEYRLLILPLIVPVCVILAPYFGSAPLSNNDVYVMLCVQLYLVSMVIVAILKRY